MYVVGVLVAGLLIGGFVSGQAVRKGPGGEGVGSCSDSDGGQNIFIQGRVSSPSQGSAVDSCNGVANLNEYYCYSKSSWTSANMPCPNGYSCSNGACTLSTTSVHTTSSTTTSILCTDSDGGQNKFVKGYIVTYQTGQVYDYCSGTSGANQSVVEYYCQSQYPGYGSILLDCPETYYCIDSACISFDTTTSTTSIITTTI